MIRFHRQSLPLLLLALGCGDDPVAETLLTIEIVPDNVVLHWLRQETLLEARVPGGTGIVQGGRFPLVNWASSDESVATISSAGPMSNEGIVTATGFGAATITASVEATTDARDSVVVTVEPQQPATVRVVRLGESRAPAPGDAPLRALGARMRLDAWGYDEAHRVVAAGPWLWNWTTDDESIATVDSLGVVTAVDNGTTVVTAASPTWGARATAQVEVAQLAHTILRVSPVADTLRALEDTLRVVVDALDANGHPVRTPAAFHWGSSDTRVATVEHQTGLVTALGNGTAEIGALSGVAYATAFLTVAQEITQLRLTAAGAAMLEVGDTVRLSAALADANGHPVEGADTVFTWSSSDQSVASVDGAGLVTAVARGTVEITARSASAGLSGVREVGVH